MLADFLGVRGDQTQHFYQVSLHNFPLGYPYDVIFIILLTNTNNLKTYAGSHLVFFGLNVIVVVGVALTFKPFLTTVRR